MHALGQVVHFLTACRHSPEIFLKALNAMLPRDVRVLAVEVMPQAFHATLDAKSKRYRYVIDNAPVASPFQLIRLQPFQLLRFRSRDRPAFPAVPCPSSEKTCPSFQSLHPTPV